MTRLNAQQIQMLKDELTVELTDWLMEKYEYTPSEAIDVLYTSENIRMSSKHSNRLLLSKRWLRSFIS